MNVHAMQGVSAYTSKVEERKPSQELGKDDFLKLLVAQMQNQDPLNPTNDTEMVAQMAQFSLLEQMQELNQSFVSAQALQLIGKTVYAEVFDSKSNEITPVIGSVDRVSLWDGKIKLGIGDAEITMNDVKEVYEAHE